MIDDHIYRHRDQRQDAFDAHDCSGARSGAGLSLPGSTVTTTGTGTYTTRSSASACQGLVQARTAASITNTATTAAVVAARDVSNHQAHPQPARDNPAARSPATTRQPP